MKFPLRRRVYAAAIASLLLALWLRPAPEAPATVLPAPSRTARPLAMPAPSGPLAPTPVAGRLGRMPQDLFGVEPPPPAPTTRPVDMPVASAPPVPQLQLLGWVLADRVAWVSVTVGNASYTLKPGEQAEALYRYDGVEEQMAVFTYLPDGTTRQYPLSEVQISE